MHGHHFHLILLDVDGTLVRPKSGATFRASPDDWELLPGRVAKLAALRAAGVHLALVTNQGGVAFGYLDQPTLAAELDTLAAQVGAERVYACYYHPKATLPEWRGNPRERKPGPGMVEAALADFGVPPFLTLLVGDREEDRDAARSAHVQFAFAADFFGDAREKEATSGPRFELV